MNLLLYLQTCNSESRRIWCAIVCSNMITNTFNSFRLSNVFFSSCKDAYQAVIFTIILAIKHHITCEFWAPTFFFLLAVAERKQTYIWVHVMKHTYTYTYTHTHKHTHTHIPRKHFFNMFYLFWSKCSRINRTYWRNISSVLHVELHLQILCHISMC